MRKLVKFVVWMAVLYALVVVAFESLLGYFQPQDESTFTITTVSQEGESQDRVLSRLDVNGKLYVAANHWPRVWFNNALANPRVEITDDGATSAYLAMPVEVNSAEHRAVDKAKPLGYMTILFGFAPRKFLRLDPVVEPQAMELEAN